MNTATNSQIEPQTGCIASAMNIVGNKWTALILRDLASGPKRFSELERSVGGINPRTLTQRLVMLETEAIIVKDADQPATYSLTAKGTDLIPVLQQMANWGTKYHTAA